MTNLPQHLQATLEILQVHASDEGKCQMSLAELAQARSITRRAIHNHVHQLELDGYLTIHYRPGKPSIYKLTSKTQQSSRLADLLRGVLKPLLSAVPSLSRGSSKGRVEGPSKEQDTRPTEPLSPSQTVGREEILATLQENAAKDQHTLLVGPLGIGKSHLLRHFATQLEQRGRGAEEQGSEELTSAPEPVLSPAEGHLRTSAHVYLEHVSPIKPALLGLAERLHADGHLEVEGIEAGYMAWEDVRKKVAPLRVNQLAELVTACMEDQDYTLVLDHLERVTPTMLPHLDALMEIATVIAAADELKPSAQRLWWTFEQVEVLPLTREQARQLLWQVADRDRVAQPQLFETRVLQQAGGNPLAIITMAGKARTADLSAQEIRGLHHGAGIRYIPLTPALMLIGALIVAARFVALGLNDRDLYVLAGLGYAFFFFMRYFIYRID